MRRFSFHGLLVVLTLAFQAAGAIGLGFDRTPWATGRNGDSAFCELGGDSSNRRQPTGHGRDAVACLSCQICLGGYSPFATLAANGYAPDRRVSSSLDWTPYRRIGARSTIAQSHRARAPPTLA